VDWAPFDRRQLTFRNLQLGEIVRVATWENGELVFQTDPFLIHCPEGDLTFFERVEETQDMIAFTKTISKREIMLQNRMVGGVVEGSDTPDFRVKDTLFVIKERPYSLLNKVQVNTDKSYRYVRYAGPEGSHCNISEIAFYRHLTDSLPLSGRAIGTPGSWGNDPSHEYPRALDGKTDTSFDYKDADGGWVGLDFGTPQRISAIVYTPRNEDNYITPGDVYELFYLDKTWHSHQIVSAGSDSLVFRNVPKNVLFYIKNHTKGIDERFFRYENNLQVF
jgi:hypothetical protein